MESSEPATIIGAIGAAAGLASAATGIVSATGQKTPEEPKAIPNAAALMADRRRQAAAQGRSSTVLTSQKLGNIGA